MNLAETREQIREGCNKLGWDLRERDDLIECVAPNGESIGLKDQTLLENGKWNADLEKARRTELRAKEGKMGIVVYGTQGFSRINYQESNTEVEQNTTGLEDKNVGILKENLKQRVSKCGLDPNSTTASVVGSYATGDADPDSSDLDIVIGTQQTFTYDERNQLQNCLTGYNAAEGEIPPWTRRGQGGAIEFEEPAPLLEGSGIKSGLVEFHVHQEQRDPVSGKGITLW